MMLKIQPGIFIIYVLLSLWACNQEHKSRKKYQGAVASDYLGTAKPTPENTPDPRYTFEECLMGSIAPDEIIQRISLLEVDYIGFDKKVHRGQLLVSNQYREEIKEIFDSLLTIGFPIEKIRPMHLYNWLDSLSMRDNNTSCFNYRIVPGSGKVSMHSYGKAVDINPVQNPWVRLASGYRDPENGNYDTAVPGTIVDSSTVVNLFRRRGWMWGGDWKYSKDYQHFYKY